MTLPHSLSVNFPYDDMNYVDALVRDYLELMGEGSGDSTVTPHNTLLVEYDSTPPLHPQNSQESASPE